MNINSNRRVFKKRRRKGYSVAIFLFLIIVFCSGSVYAISMSPASKSIDFYPNGSEEVKYTLRNNEDEEMFYEIKTSGDFEEYINCPEEVKVESNSNNNFYCNVSFPSNAEEMGFGSHKSRISVSEAGGNSESIIGVKIRVESLIKLEVPYPENYIESTLEKVDIGKKNVSISSKLVNKGDKKQNVDVSFKLLRTDNEVWSRKVENLDIGVEGEEQFDWNIGNITPGNYSFITTLVTPNDTFNFTEKITIPRNIIMMEDFKVEKIEEEKYDISFYLVNNIDKKIDDVEVNMSIFNENNEEVDEVSFGEFNFSSSERKEISLDYSGRLDKRNLFKFSITTEDNSFIIEKYGEIGDKGAPFLILAIILIGFVLVYFLWYFFKRNVSRDIEDNS